ncbi:hypothetical protein C1J00_40975 [Streptomyces cahuitamycinicus]|uniref:Uncharacterized protein n=1 Tax=Streptomyces cahuitamycinicus TaxID=2070367 RepID=A0A2N8TC72_9ACTN|nr:hypothetical protein C1J00_40975 [Streptomyces cahuitamycinicus]
MVCADTPCAVISSRGRCGRRSSTTAVGSAGPHPATVVTAPLVGPETGVLAGLHPAWRASRIQPAEALRR